MGVCLGVMASEKLYLVSQEAALEPGAAAAAAAARSRKLEVGGGGGSAAALAVRRGGGKPRNALEEILQRVAPQGEVMIAISNFNLVLESSLVMWLEVGAAGARCLGCRTAAGASDRGAGWGALLQPGLPSLPICCSWLLWPAAAPSPAHPPRLPPPPLPLPLQCVQGIPGLTNWLVVAIDEQLRDYCVEVRARGCRGASPWAATLPPALAGARSPQWGTCD